jgi:hypothetical protein
MELYALNCPHWDRRVDRFGAVFELAWLLPLSNREYLANVPTRRNDWIEAGGLFI